ncbi:MAG: TIGR04086 family membrane protein [Ruminococcaceae bacterium]|nr:TIGR04086 family membrane protein [Oscillospiraceae bacterium]
MKGNVRSSRGLFLSCLMSQIVWFVSAVILLLLFCAISNSMSDPESVSMPLSLCALYLSAIIGGVGAVKLSGDGILSGLVSGFISAGIILLLSALPLPSSGLSTVNSIILLLLVIPASVIGSFIGKKRSKKIKHYSKRKRP